MKLGEFIDFTLLGLPLLSSAAEKKLRYAVIGLMAGYADLVESNDYEACLSPIFSYLIVGYDAIGKNLDKDHSDVEADPIPIEEFPILIGKLSKIIHDEEFFNIPPNRELIKDLLDQIYSDLHALIEDNDLDIYEILEPK